MEKKFSSKNITQTIISVIKLCGSNKAITKIFFLPTDDYYLEAGRSIDSVLLVLDHIKNDEMVMENWNKIGTKQLVTGEFGIQLKRYEGEHNFYEKETIVEFFKKKEFKDIHQIRKYIDFSLFIGDHQYALNQEIGEQIQSELKNEYPDSFFCSSDEKNNGGAFLSLFDPQKSVEKSQEKLDEIELENLKKALDDTDLKIQLENVQETLIKTQEEYSYDGYDGDDNDNDENCLRKVQ